MLDASTTAALVAAVEDYRATTGASLLAVGHDQVLLDRWCDRTLHWDDITGRPRREQDGSRRHRACGSRPLCRLPVNGEKTITRQEARGALRRHGASSRLSPRSLTAA